MLRSIAYNYPGFQSLPRGIRKMLIVTESFFFFEEEGRGPTPSVSPAARVPAPPDTAPKPAVSSLTYFPTRHSLRSHPRSYL
jgi:hypothetical protein